MPGWVMGMCVRAPAVSNKLHISYVNSARYIEGYMGKVRNRDQNHRSSPRKSVSHRAQLLAVARWKGLSRNVQKSIGLIGFRFHLRAQSVSSSKATSFFKSTHKQKSKLAQRTG